MHPVPLESSHGVAPTKLFEKPSGNIHSVHGLHFDYHEPMLFVPQAYNNGQQLVDDSHRAGFEDLSLASCLSPSN